MNENTNKNIASTVLTELSLGAGLFLGGLFLTVGTWGVLSPIGIFMMVLGVVVPVWLITTDPKGKIWRQGGTMKRSTQRERSPATSKA